jgi:4-hydroxy-tetrahydrodipicolinate synthase
VEETKAVDPSVVVVAGVSTPNLTMTLDLARFASDSGADLLQLMPTYCLPMVADDVVSYYEIVSNAISTPVMVYEMPLASGVQFNAELLQRICDHCPNVIALKTASPLTAPWEFERIVHRFGDRLAIFAATGAYFSPFTYMTGVRGITDTMANAVPEFGLTLHRLARAKEWDEMNRIYHEAFDVLEIEMIYGRAGLREIGNVCGLNLGAARHPMADVLSAKHRSEIRRRLERWPYSQELLAKPALVGTDSPQK